MKTLDERIREAMARLIGPDATVLCPFCHVPMVYGGSWLCPLPGTSGYGNWQGWRCATCETRVDRPYWLDGRDGGNDEHAG